MSDTSDSLVERLFAQHGRALRSYFRRRVRAAPDAADLAQEVYLRLLRTSHAEEIEDPRAYLYTIAANLLKEHYVRESRHAPGRDDRNTPATEAAGGSDAVTDEAERIQSRVRLRSAVDALPPRWSHALALRYTYELSFDDIARHLQVSPTMAKKYVAQALARCREWLGKTEMDYGVD